MHLNVLFIITREYLGNQESIRKIPLRVLDWERGRGRERKKKGEWGKKEGEGRRKEEEDQFSNDQKWLLHIDSPEYAKSRDWIQRSSSRDRDIS